MWVMAGLVWRKLFSRRMSALLFLCLVGLGLIAFDPDAGTIISAGKAWGGGHIVVLTLASLAVLFLGGNQIAIGIHDRTAMFWLTHSLPRWKFVIGKFMGACFVGWILLIGFGLAVAAMFAIRGLAPSASYYGWLAADLLRIVMLSAVLTFISTGLGYMSTSLIGGVICLAGFCTFVLSVYAKLVDGSPAGWLLWGLYILIPNWEHFGFGVEVASSPVYWIYLAVYALAYAWFYTIFAVLIFQWRDLK